MRSSLWADAYRNMVTLAVLEALDRLPQGEYFTLQEFANHFDLKITHNLRRRLAELCDEGQLSRLSRYGRNARFAWHYGHCPGKPLPPNENQENEFESGINTAMGGL